MMAASPALWIFALFAGAAGNSPDTKPLPRARRTG